MIDFVFSICRGFCISNVFCWSRFRERPPRFTSANLVRTSFPCSDIGENSNQTLRWILSHFYVANSWLSLECFMDGVPFVFSGVIH